MFAVSESEASGGSVVQNRQITGVPQELTSLLPAMA
jgi:hypothetical protein